MKWNGKRYLLTAVCFGLTGVSQAATPSAKPNSNLPAPAQVINPPYEETLANVILTSKAEQRLAITTAPIEQRNVPRYQLYGGQVMYPLGQAEPGTIAEVQPPQSPAAIVALIQAQIDADAAVSIANVEMEAGRVALAREEKLLATKTGTVKAVDEAKARMGKAAAALTAAQARRKFLGASMGNINLKGKVWLRVPVYAGDAARLDRTAEIRVTELGGRADAPAIAGTPIQGVPTAGTNGATVDWYYEFDNSQGKYVPGHRLALKIPLKGPVETLVIPWSSVLHDIHGGTWVYEQLAPQKYVRRRVEISSVQNGIASLNRGPALGTKVVTAGAIELFGTEFGNGN